MSLVPNHFAIVKDTRSDTLSSTSPGVLQLPMGAGVPTKIDPKGCIRLNSTNNNLLISTGTAWVTLAPSLMASSMEAQVENEQEAVKPFTPPRYARNCFAPRASLPPPENN